MLYRRINVVFQWAHETMILKSIRLQRRRVNKGNLRLCSTYDYDQSSEHLQSLLVEFLRKSMRLFAGESPYLKVHRRIIAEEDQDLGSKSLRKCDEVYRGVRVGVAVGLHVVR